MFNESADRARLWCYLLSQGLEVKNFVFLSDAEKKLILSWRNNPEISRFMFRKSPISFEEHNFFISELFQSNDRFYYLLFKKDCPIGVVNFNKVDWKKRIAKFGLYKNPKLAISVGNVLLFVLEFLADFVLNLSILMAEVFSYNEKAIRLYRRFNYEFCCQTGDILIFKKCLKR